MVYAPGSLRPSPQHQLSSYQYQSSSVCNLTDLTMGNNVNADCSHYPLPCVAYQSPPMPVTEYYTSPSCDDLHHCRTLSNIVWSCVVTVFSCTWIALHPNIPSPDDGSFRIALRRVKLMVMGLIAPELVVAWAMRQWFVSRRLAEKHRGELRAILQPLCFITYHLCRSWMDTISRIFCPHGRVHVF